MDHAIEAPRFVIFLKSDLPQSTEACYYEISPLVAAIQHQMRLSGRAIPASAPIPNTLTTRSCEFECVTVHISPDIGK